MRKILILLLFIPVVGFTQSPDGTFKTLTATMPTTDNYVISEPLPSTYDSKEKFIVIFPFANAGTSPTLNRNSLGAKAIKNEDGTSPAIGAICACRKLLSYNGTNFQLVGGSGSASWPLNGSASLTGNVTINGVGHDLAIGTSASRLSSLTIEGGISGYSTAIGILSSVTGINGFSAITTLGAGHYAGGSVTHIGTTTADGFQSYIDFPVEGYTLYASKSGVGFAEIQSTSPDTGATYDLNIFADRVNIVGASKKLGFFAATPVIKQSAVTSTQGIADVLSAYGLIPSSTISGAGSGTVTSVAQSFTGGLISVGGSPITTTGTLALTVAGTSGGIPYFSSSSTWASSSLLAANALVIGGGAGVSPSTTTTGTAVLTALGTNVGSAGAFVVNGGVLGTPSSGVATNLTGLPVSTGISGLGSGVATWLATPSWTNFSATITGTAPFWNTGGTTTLISANTISSTTPSGLNFSNSWTATANNQSAVELLGTITSRSTASDLLRYLYIDPTLVSSAATQTLTAVSLNPTFTDINSASKYILHLRNAGTETASFAHDGSVRIISGSSSTQPTLALTGIGAGTNYTLRLFQGGGATEILSVRDNGLINAVNVINGSNFSSTWTATANSQNAFEMSGVITSRNTNTDALHYFVIDPTLVRNAGNPSSQTLNAVTIAPTFTNVLAGVGNALKVVQGGVTALTIGSLANNVVNVSIGADPLANATLYVKSTQSQPTLLVQGQGTSSNVNFQLKNSIPTTLFQVTDYGDITITNQAHTSVTNTSFSITQGVYSAGLGQGLVYTAGAHTNQTGEVVDFNMNTTRAVGFANTTSISNQRAVIFGNPTYSATSGTATATTLASVDITGAPIVGTGLTVTNTIALNIRSAAVGTATNSYGLSVNAMTGSTNNYAAQFIGNTTKFIGLGSSTQKLLDAYQSDGTTNIMFLKDNGDFSIGLSTSSIGLYATTPTIQGAVGTTLINNVTTGGTTGQIDDFTSLTVYATDAPTIRNDIYQLSKKVNILEAKLKLLGAVKD